MATTTGDLTVKVHVDTEALAAELRAVATELMDAAQRISDLGSGEEA